MKWTLPPCKREFQEALGQRGVLPLLVYFKIAQKSRCFYNVLSKEQKMAFRPGTKKEPLQPRGAKEVQKAALAPVERFKMYVDDADKSVYDPVFNKIGGGSAEEEGKKEAVVQKHIKALEEKIKYLCGFLKYSQEDTHILLEAAKRDPKSTQDLIDDLHKEYVLPILNPQEHHFEQFLSTCDAEKKIYIQYVTQGARCILEFEKQSTPAYLHHYHGATLDASQGASFLELLAKK